MISLADECMGRSSLSTSACFVSSKCELEGNVGWNGQERKWHMLSSCAQCVLRFCHQEMYIPVFHAAGIVP